MSKVGVTEAAAYGLELTKGQQEIMAGEHRFAIAPQVMPDPMCWVAEGARVPFWAHDGSCYAKQVLVPTIIEIAKDIDPADHELSLNRWQERDDGWDYFPTVAGWAVDMAALASDMSCEHQGYAPAGMLDLGCECDYHALSVVSPYTLIPVSEEDARVLLRQAYGDLLTGSWRPLLDIAELECGYGDGTFEEDQELANVIASGLDWDLSGGVHVPPHEMGYTIPGEPGVLKKKIVTQLKRTQRAFNRLLKDDAVNTAQQATMFAFPTDYPEEFE